MNVMGRVHIAVMVAMGILISLMIVPLPFNDVSYLEDPTLHLQARQIFYWSCSFITFIWLIKTTSDNLGGTIACTLLGPITLLTMLLMWISYKVFPHKKKVKKDE